jgi:hypothetical protein
MFKCLSKDVNSFKSYIMLYCKVVVLHDVMKYVVGNNDCVKINIHCTHICVFSNHTIIHFVFLFRTSEHAIIFYHIGHDFAQFILLCHGLYYSEISEHSKG